LGANIIDFYLINIVFSLIGNIFFEGDKSLKNKVNAMKFIFYCFYLTFPKAVIEREHRQMIDD